MEYSFDVPKYLFTGELDDNTMSRITTTIRGTVSDETNWMIGNWDAHDFLYNSGMSMLESFIASKIPYVGGVVLGMSAASSATNDALDRGMDNSQAFWAGAAAGGFETLFESWSIGKFKSMQEGVSSGGKAAMKNIAKSMLVNASEETLTEIANIVYDTVANGDFSSYETSIRQYMSAGMSESEAKSQVAKELGIQVAEAAGSGALMGIGFGGIAEGGKAVKATLTGRSIKKAAQSGDLQISDIADVGRSLGEGTESYRLADKITDKSSAYAIGALYGIEGVEISEANRGDIVKSLERKGYDTKTATQIADIMLNPKSDAYASVALQNPQTFSDIILNPNSTVSQRTNPYTAIKSAVAESKEARKSGKKATPKAEDIEKVAKEYEAKGLSPEEAKAMAVAQLSQSGEVQSSPAEETAVESKYEIADDGKTTNLRTGDTAEVINIESISADGEARLTLDNKTVAKASDIAFGSPAQATFIENIGAMKLGKTPISTASANLLYNAAMSELKSNPNMTENDAMSLIRGLADAYIHGAYNFGMEALTEKDEKGSPRRFAGELSQTHREYAYNLGVKDSISNVEADQKAVDKVVSKAKAKSKAKKAHLGKVIFESQIDENSLTQTKKANLNGIKLLAELTNYEIHVFESDENYNFTMPNGAVRSANGWYVSGTNQIWIDLNAGNAGEGTMMWTAAHEISHDIKRKSPKQWKAMADLVMKTFAENGENIEGMLNRQKEKIKKRYTEKDMPSDAEILELAYEELVCDALTDMLTDGSIVNFIAEVKAKDKNLAQRILDSIKSLLKKWGLIVDSYKGRDLDTLEAQALSKYKDVFKKLQEMYRDALMDADSVTAVANDIVNIDADSKSVAPMMSERTWTESEYVTEREKTAKAISKSLGVDIETAYKYIDDINSVARLIADDRVRLDYDPNIDEGATVLKPNSDYKYSVDMSTLCAKRLLTTGTFDAIQRKLPNTVFTSEDIVALREMMLKRGYEVACGICYVESTRREMGRITQDFINSYIESQKTGKPITRINSSGKAVELRKTIDEKASTVDKTTDKFYAEKDYTPTLADLNTTDIDVVKKEHPLVYEAYLNFMNARGQAKPKLLETRAEYKGEILKHFKTKTAVNARNNAGGLRLQSFSDFEVPHLIDMMQIVMDMSRVGLKSQAYTKVPAFAEVFGNTGVKINLSLIAKGSGLDANGNLIFDDVEGINHEEAFKLREKFSKNVGTILVGKTDAHIIAAMADPRIDYIIPFHKSSWKESLYEALGLTGYADYTDTQNEKPIDKDRKIKNFDPSEYWDFTKSGDENAQIYLEMCRKDGRIPKFPQFQGYPGYWKLLIDFKMYDNDGVGSPQEVVTPTFEMDSAEKILNEYKGGHRSFPVAKDVVEDFVNGYVQNIKFSERNGTPYDFSKPFEQQIDDYQNGVFPVYDTLVVGGTPQILLDIGMNALPITYPTGHLKEVIKGVKQDHDFGIANLKKLPNALKNPIAVIETRSPNAVQNSLVIILDLSHKGKHMIAAMVIDGEGFMHQNKIDSNAITTVHTRENTITGLLKDAVVSEEAGNGGIYYWQKNKATQLLSTSKVQFLGGNNIADGFIRSISHHLSKVNTKLKNVLESKQFLRFFGDWIHKPSKASKVVNKDGTPRIVYHYTDATFWEFDTAKSGSNQGQTHGDGIYISTSPDAFSYAGKNRMELYANIRNPFEMQLTDEQATYVLEKYAATKHDLDKFNGLYRNHAMEKLTSPTRVFDYLSEYAADNGIKVSDILKDLGFDGVHDGNEWVAFDRTQLKSATDNIGTFDGTNPDIRYSERDSQGHKLSEEQVEFFKDSKIRDEKGRLLAVYHGTKHAGFTKFTKTDEIGYFFARTLRTAQTYSNHSKTIYAPDRYTETAVPDEANYQVYLNIKNPYIIDGKGVNWNGLEATGEKVQISIKTSNWGDNGKGLGKITFKYGGKTYSKIVHNMTEFDAFITKHLNAEMSSALAYAMNGVVDKNGKGKFEAGIAWDFKNSKDAETKNTRDIVRRAYHSKWNYDGVIFRNVVDSGDGSKIKADDLYVAFNSNQIKSTANTEPTSHPDIRFQERDPSASNRGILANALESAAQNDIERKKLEEYKKKISLIEAEESRLAEIQRKLFTKGEVDPTERKALQFEAKQIANRINTYDRQLLTLESTAALKGVLNREKALAAKRQKQRDAEILRKAKERAAETQRELMTRYQESRKKATESRHRTEMRHKIQRVVAELNTLLTKGNKKKHIPEELKVAVADVLELFNMDTVGADERVAKYDALIAKAKDPDVIASLTETRDRIQKQGDKFSAKLDKLKSAYETIRTSADPEIAGGFDEAVTNRIQYVANKVGKTSLRDMTLEQLEDVYDVYTMVLNNIREANTLFKKDKAETIQNISSRVIGETKQAGGEHEYTSPRTKGIKTFLWNNLKPIFAFEKIGSKALTDLFKDVRKGEDTWAVDVEEATEFAESQYKKRNYKKWDLNKKYHFKTTTGESFSLTLEQMMSLYAFSKRPQADDHLTIGGFVFDSSITVHKEKVLDDDGKTKKSILKYEVNTAKAHQISKKTLAKIISNLTSEQRAFVDEMQAYLSDVMGAKGNEVSMTLYGIRLFKEKFYFPLKSAKQFMFEQNEVAGEVRIKNSGFTESTVEHANNPIILTNFMDVWANHVNDMSMYHSFVVPLENFNRVFNYQTRRAEGMPPVSVKGTIQNAYGRQAVEYIRQLLTDLNGGARSDPRETFAKKLTSTFKKAKVFVSNSVVIQQPSAVARALALIDARYFDYNPKLISHNKLWAELKKYAPVAIIKEMGRFDTDMGLSTAEYIKGQKTFFQKAEDWLSKAPAVADELTWVHIWTAVKRETQAKHKELKVGSEEFLKTAGERFTEVVMKTQVYDSVLSRSANMRSKSALMSMATAFLAEGTTAINMVENAFGLWQRGYKRTALKQLKGVSASVILNAALVSIVYAMRDDDEDETFLEKYLSSFVTETADGFNPLTYIPWVKDVWSLLQGYSVERTDMSLFSDIIDAFKGFTQTAISYDEEMTEEEEQEFKDGMRENAWKLVDGIAAIFGIPAGNIRRDIESYINTYNTLNNGASTSKSSLKDEMTESVKDITPVWGWWPDKSKGDKLYDAIVSGDTDYVDRLKNGYKDEKAYENALRKALRENDPRIKEAAEARYAGNNDEYMRIAKEIKAEGNFSQDTIVAAINAEISKLKPKEESESSSPAFLTLEDYYKSLLNGDTYTAQTIKDELVAEKLAEGYLQHEAEDLVATSLTSRVKSEYMDGNITRSTATAMISEYGGMTYGGAETEIKKCDFELEYGLSWSERARGYRLGKISKGELISAVMDIEGEDYQGANDYIRFLDLEVSNPNTDITASDAKGYFEYAEPAGININVYLSYKEKTSGLTGDKDANGKTINGSKKNKVLAVINSLPISNAQKDALYYANGWSAKTINEAPWH